MKNILLRISFFLTGIVLFSSCNPTKDFTDEYSKYNNSSKMKFADTVSVYNLMSTDYASSSVADIVKNKNFSDAAPAAPVNLLDILQKRYIAKIAASIKIGYAYYSPLTQHDSENYTLVNADYPDTYYDFSTLAQASTCLIKLYPTATTGKTVVLTYNWYASSKITAVTNTFVYTGSTWLVPTPFILADYTAMGQGTYANFNTLAIALNNIPIYLKNTKYPYAVSGDKYLIQYAVNKVTLPYTALYTYNGSAWVPYNAVSTAYTMVSFDGLLWKLPPPVKVVFSTDATNPGAIAYTLVTADYRLVGNTYDDFQRNIVGSYEEPDAVFLGKMGTILKTKYAATIAIGQVYAVTYGDYNGSIVAKTVYLKVVAL